MANTLFDKIWDAHVVQKVEDGPTQLYIDRLYCHEVTSPQAFAGMRARAGFCRDAGTGIEMFPSRKDLLYARSQYADTRSG